MVTKVEMDGWGRPLDVAAWRSFPLARIETWANLPDVAAELRTRRDNPTDEETFEAKIDAMSEEEYQQEPVARRKVRRDRLRPPSGSAVRYPDEFYGHVADAYRYYVKRWEHAVPGRIAADAEVPVSDRSTAGRRGPRRRGSPRSGPIEGTARLMARLHRPQLLRLPKRTSTAVASSCSSGTRAPNAHQRAGRHVRHEGRRRPRRKGLDRRREPRRIARPSAMTVNDWLDDWLELCVTAGLRPRTIYDYGNKLRVHVRPTIGSLPVQEVEPVHLDRIYAAITAAGQPRTAATSTRSFARRSRTRSRRDAPLEPGRSGDASSSSSGSSGGASNLVAGRARRVPRLARGLAASDDVPSPRHERTPPVRGVRAHVGRARPRRGVLRSEPVSHRQDRTFTSTGRNRSAAVGTSSSIRKPSASCGPIDGDRGRRGSSSERVPRRRLRVRATGRQSVEAGLDHGGVPSSHRRLTGPIDHAARPPARSRLLHARHLDRREHGLRPPRSRHGRIHALDLRSLPAGRQAEAVRRVAELVRAGQSFR